MPCAVCNASVPLEFYRQYPAGQDSTGIIAADVDGDGYLDLIVSNRGTSDVSILINNGIGLFPTTTHYPTGEVPRYVDGADFDGDGDFDLCTPDYIGMTTTVLENDGNGVFSILAQYPMRTPAFLWVDDIDSDGHQDILVLHWDENADQPAWSPSLFLPLLNNGDGSFTAGSTSWIGLQPRCGASADLNGDGILDVVTANYTSQTLSVILGLGKQQWADEVSIQLSGNPRYLVLEDLNDDGDIDIVSIDKSNNQLWVFQNDGFANFVNTDTYSTNNNPHSIDAGDVDLDGDIDLIVTHVSSAQQLLYLNNGDGTFPIIQNVFMPTGPAEVKFADINNDGKLDVVSANVNYIVTEDRGATVVLQGTCDVEDGTSEDCNLNKIADICDLPDCNYNSIPDECDIATGFSFDLDFDGVPDDCQTDCNGNGIPDQYEIDTGLINDCNSNDIPDDCDWPSAGDCDNDGIIDGCETDLNLDSIPDDCQCNADFTGDGEVAVEDLLNLIAAWGDIPEPHGDFLLEDLNVDDVVDVNDLLLLMAAWGDCPDDMVSDVTGACCRWSNFCVNISEVACGVLSGQYMGDNTLCEDVDCQNP
jgi:hypothetical protein